MRKIKLINKIAGIEEMEEDQNKENVSANIKKGKMSNSKRVFKPRSKVELVDSYSEKESSVEKITEPPQESCESFTFQIKLPTTNL